ncbi:MAG: peptide chain release factor N(5)-glutamine methyltransferase [Bacteroidales bacterium]
MRETETYRALLAQLKNHLAFLPDKPEETLESTLDALWHLSAGKAYTAEMAIQHPLPALSEAQYKQLTRYVQERIEGKPLSHITGKQNFMGIEMHVTKDALIPRKETEILGKLVSSLISESAHKTEHPLVVDVCTGMGNLPLAYAYSFPNARILAADLSEKAIELAKENATTLNLSNAITWFVGDLLHPLDDEKYAEQVDIISCNPPYISSGKLEKMPAEIIGHEPEMAFNGGPFGIKILSRLLKEGLPYLKGGGWLCFEVGLGQGPGMQQLLERNPSYQQVRTATDAEGNIRALAAQKHL